MLGYGGMGYGFYGLDPTYLLVIIGMLLCLAASWGVNSTFKKYAKVRSKSGLTGAEAAERILRTAGIYDVMVQHIRGNLNDHYDPRKKVLNLSDATYASASVAAVGVAAHEAGHAIQHSKSYVPLTLRTAIVPAANLGSMLAWPLIIIGLFLTRNSGNGFILAGIICFAASVLFQLVTLPVEFDASGRALQMLERTGVLGSEEIRDTRKVLTAAGLTYIASAAASILQLLRLLMIFSGGRNDRR